LRPFTLGKLSAGTLFQLLQWSLNKPAIDLPASITRRHARHGLARHRKAKLPLPFFSSRKKFCTFSAAMHSDAQTLLLTLAYLPRTMRSPVLM
jgi:hypothetical protein